MRAILVTFDSLNRRMLPNYGCDQVIAPGFLRLGQFCTRFDNCYAGSLPCIPARREMHTARENFLHHRWAEIEPFDDSAMEMLTNHGVYTHLVTDHAHYWGELGFGYHSRYSSFRFSRGQEGDPVYGQVNTDDLKPEMEGRRVAGLRIQDAVNRRHNQAAEAYPQAVTFRWGLEFLEANHESDNWFLHIETFDPHEPFTAPEEFRKLYDLPPAQGQKRDWPDYCRDTGIPPEQITAYRQENRALVSFCSHNLNRLLDAMDRYDMWKDTLLIVNTDHGFLLGEHGWLGKNTGPYYNEIAHIPLFIHDPRDRERPVSSPDLVQTVDIPATLLDYFGIPLTSDMTGRPIRCGHRTETRDTAKFGLFGGHVNITDGRYLFMRAPREPGQPYAYTLGGTHFMRWRLQGRNDPYTVELAGPFSFTKGSKVLKIGNMSNDFGTVQPECGDLLFDLAADPGQEHPIRDPQREQHFCRILSQWFREMDAPAELYGHYGLENPKA